ncbi:deoxyribonuclease-2-beta-like [Perca flavescens]|uniref:deoxyribonuclease-2-beta-like n=1 Tax=Perca flavescens TaxID=8167 RepID=UPI00106DECEA|nr:deoxyribonuclease-2-beta-like [Perca flavescens]
MWRIFLTVSLLCWSADGRVTCKNNNNAEVDWFIIYKVPVTDKTTGFEYLYIDSAGKTTSKPINNPNGVLANTLRPIFTTSMTDNFAFISYNDQPPGCDAIAEFGHSKGVVMMDTTTGVWLLHSVPRFPFKRDQNKFYPDSGVKNAQTFICVTFNYNTFQQIGEHLLDINAFTFDDHIPNNFHDSLKKLRRTENNNRTPRVNQVKIKDLTSARGTSFRSIAKKQYKEGEEAEDDECDDGPSPTKKPRPGPPSTTKAPKEEYEGDLYLTIAETYTTNVKVQTWCSKKEGCYSGEYQVIRIKSVKANLGNVLVQWKPGKDHSKWCVAEDNNNHLICIADVNRGLSQYKRPGGALCFIHQGASELFQDVIAETEECS